MTKTIRIENADTAAYKVVVEVWDKGVGDAPDVKVDEVPLDHPTALAERYITSTRYLIIREV